MESSLDKGAQQSVFPSRQRLPNRTSAVEFNSKQVLRGLEAEAKSLRSIHWFVAKAIKDLEVERLSLEAMERVLMGVQANEECGAPHSPLVETEMPEYSEFIQNLMPLTSSRLPSMGQDLALSSVSAIAPNPTSQTKKSRTNRRRTNNPNSSRKPQSLPTNQVARTEDLPGNADFGLEHISEGFLATLSEANKILGQDENPPGEVETGAHCSQAVQQFMPQEDIEAMEEMANILSS